MVFEDDGCAVEVGVARAEEAAGEVGVFEADGKRLGAAVEQGQASACVYVEVEGRVARREAVTAQGSAETPFPERPMARIAEVVKFKTKG